MDALSSATLSNPANLSITLSLTTTVWATNSLETHMDCVSQPRTEIVPDGGRRVKPFFEPNTHQYKRLAGGGAVCWSISVSAIARHVDPPADAPSARMDAPLL